jgi:hypothetical protein
LVKEEVKEYAEYAEASKYAENQLGAILTELVRYAFQASPLG